MFYSQRNSLFWEFRSHTNDRLPNSFPHQFPHPDTESCFSLLTSGNKSVYLTSSCVTKKLSIYWPSVYFVYLPHQTGFPIGSVVKNLPAKQETQVWSLGWEDTLQKEMVNHSNILAWDIPWTEEPDGLQSMGL